MRYIFLICVALLLTRSAAGANAIELDGRMLPNATWRSAGNDFWFPVLVIGQELGLNLSYERGQVRLNGRPIRCTPRLIDGQVHVTRNDLRHGLGLRVSVHPDTLLARISSVMGVGRPRQWSR